MGIIINKVEIIINLDKSGDVLISEIDTETDGKK